ncbi:MAG: lipid-A-disaccharide synthase [Desulfobacter sp.]|nr:lipid-A-disaccharide synthase [Desulfobacter sp.]WDP86354.1 MAG: lipid-A-disaccharide synthase [Desulfobacter sp.]
MNPPPLHIMILTGEPSGDFHAAFLIQALNQIDPNLRISGIGGPGMKKQGAKLFFPIERLSAMGLVQVIKQLGTIKEAFRTVRARLTSDRPDIVVLIDYPGFNLRVAKYIKENTRIPVCYYIAPKVWAWNSARLDKIKAYVDHVALIFPFESPIYKQRKIAATYVGNPLMDEYPRLLPPPAQGTRKPNKIIGLLPGSRRSEIQTLLPVMLGASQKIKKIHPDAKIIVSAGSKQNQDRIQTIIKNQGLDGSYKIIEGRPLSIFEQADMLIAASGTVTLEAALCGLPTIIVYKLSPIAYRLARLVVKIKYAGLANLIMGREVMPELLQGDANPEQICQTAISMLNTLEAHREKLAGVRQRLGSPGAPKRTAQIILNLIKASASNP